MDFEKYVKRFEKKIKAERNSAGEDYDDYFLRKYTDDYDSMKSEIEKALFENDPLTEDQKKEILDTILLSHIRIFESDPDPAIVYPLLTAGADVNCFEYSGLFRDFMIGKLEHNKDKKVSMQIMDILLTYSNFQVNVKTGTGETPLMLACLMGSYKAFSKLCEHPNIDFNCRNTAGYSAIHHALMASIQTQLQKEEYFEEKRKILEKIFNPDSTDFDVEVQDKNESNILEFGLNSNLNFREFYWIWEILFKHPVISRMVNARNKEGNSLLFQSIKLNKLDMVGYLLQHPDLNLDLVNSEGRTVVQVAVDHLIDGGLPEGVELCLKQFSEHLPVRRMLNVKNKDGDPPIIQLLKHGRVDLVNILLESPDIDLDVCDSAGRKLETIAR